LPQDWQARVAETPDAGAKTGEVWAKVTFATKRMGIGPQFTHRARTSYFRNSTAFLMDRWLACIAFALAPLPDFSRITGKPHFSDRSLIQIIDIDAVS
jgi:hypothetical protein